MIFSLTISPSIAEEVIPQAYQAPSPLGNIPLIFDSKLSGDRTIRTTAELRASMAMSRAQGSASHLIFLSKSMRAFLRAFVIKSGRQASIFVSFIPGRYVVFGGIFQVELFQVRKSPTS